MKKLFLCIFIHPRKFLDRLVYVFRPKTKQINVELELKKDFILVKKVEEGVSIMATEKKVIE